MKNLIGFFEIPAADFLRAVDFYETVFHLQFSVSECEYEKMACIIDEGQPVGAISHAAGFLPSPNGVLIHFHCENMESTLNQVLLKGGKVWIPKTKIEADNPGYFAVFADSEGNHIGIYSEN